MQLTQQQIDQIEKILEGYRDGSYTVLEILQQLEQINLTIIGKPEPIRVKMND